jgi:predicted XRE-type DNA-binding protein
MYQKTQRLRKRRAYLVARAQLRNVRSARDRALEDQQKPKRHRKWRNYPFGLWQAEIDALSALTEEYEMALGKQPPDRLGSRHPLTHALDVPHALWLLRQACGLKQSELAAQLGTTQSQVSTGERAGYTGHTVAYLTRFAAALGYEIDVVFTRQCVSS